MGIKPHEMLGCYKMLWGSRDLARRNQPHAPGHEQRLTPCAHPSGSSQTTKRSWMGFKSKPIFQHFLPLFFPLKIIINFQRYWDWRGSLLPALCSHLPGCSGSFPWDARAGPMATLWDSTELVPWQYINTAATSSSEVLCEQEEARAHLNHQDLWKLVTARSQISLFLTIRSKPWRHLPSLIQTLHLCNFRESSGPSSS